MPLSPAFHDAKVKSHFSFMIPADRCVAAQLSRLRSASVGARLTSTGCHAPFRHSESDIITFHTPLTKDNYHMINRDTIAGMKDGVIHNRKMLILKAYPNVIVSPHAAFYTDQASADMVRCSVEGLAGWLQGKDNPYEIRS